MGSNWGVFELGEITEWFSGGTPPVGKPIYWDGNIPWISAASMEGSRYESSTRMLSEAGLKCGSRLAEANTVLLLVRGSILHQRIPVGMAMIPVAFNQDVKAIKAKNAIDPWFLLYWLIGHETELLSLVSYTGIGAGKFDISQLQKLPIHLPPLSEQIRIVNIVKKIDNKIALNRKTNETLEQITQALFKSWFVDFDPVKDKAEGRQPGGMDEVTAALFPDSFEESELGMIPKGWTPCELKTVTTTIRRGISPNYTEVKGFQIINQKCIRNHTIDFSLTRRHNQDKKKIEGREVQVGDVLVNSTGVGTLGRIALVRYLPEPTVCDSHVTVIGANSNVITKSFLAGLLILNESFIQSSGTGSTGQTELSREVLERISICKPCLKLLEAFERVSWPIQMKIGDLEKQSTHLASIRYSLLPKLLSGDITIAEASEQEGF